MSRAQTLYLLLALALLPAPGRASLPTKACALSSDGREVLSPGPGAVRTARMYIQGSHTSASDLPADLFETLNSIATTKKVLDPQDVFTIPLRTEARIYFSTENGRSIRLTIRRLPNGEWRFGNSSRDRRSITETQFNIQSGERLYTDRERKSLEARLTFSKTRLKGYFKEHLKEIYTELLHSVLVETHPQVMRAWLAAVPQHVHTPEAHDLILRSLGMHFDFVTGLTQGAPLKLSPQGHQIIAGIKYLNANNLTYRTRDDAVLPDIYPNSENFGLALPTPLPLTQDLIEAFARRGVTYRNGEWR